MKYFFDNCISYRLVDMLKALDVKAEALRETFASDIKDVELFEQIGRDVVLVSTDRRQTTVAEEAKLLRKRGITAIYFGPFWANLKLWDSAVWLVRRWPTIDGFVTGAERGTVAEIKNNGKAMVIPP